MRRSTASVLALAAWLSAGPAAAEDRLSLECGLTGYDHVNRQALSRTVTYTVHLDTRRFYYVEKAQWHPLYWVDETQIVLFNRPVEGKRYLVAIQRADGAIETKLTHGSEVLAAESGQCRKVDYKDPGPEEKLF